MKRGTLAALIIGAGTSAAVTALPAWARQMYGYPEPPPLTAALMYCHSSAMSSSSPGGSRR